MIVCDHCKNEVGVEKFEVNMNMKAGDSAVAVAMIRCELCNECRQELAEAMSLEFCKFFGGRDNVNFFCDKDRATYGGEWANIPTLSELANKVCLGDIA